MPVTQTREETQQVANTHVQHVINTVRVEILKIIKKTVEGPQLQIVEETAKTPETQTIQGTQTFESLCKIMLSSTWLQHPRLHKELCPRHTQFKKRPSQLWQYRK